MLLQAARVATSFGTVQLDAAQAVRILTAHDHILLRHQQRQEQLRHRLAHYHEQLTLAEEGLRQSIQLATAAVRADDATLGHVNLTVFDTLHRLLNDVELVSLDMPLESPPPLELPTPTITPAPSPASASGSLSGSLSGSESGSDT
jgi:hypothetical protein